MAYELSIFEDASLNAGFIQWLIEQQWPVTSRHFNRLWDYYANPATETLLTSPDGVADSSRGYVQAQEIGLPVRITGKVFANGADPAAGKSVADIQRKEVVIENDIAWRINAMVDFLFGKPITIQSTAADANRRRNIQAILQAVFDANGGAVFFQDLAVLGSVYGFVDCIVRPGGSLIERLVNGTSLGTSTITPALSLDSVLRSASEITLELIDAPRALPVLEETDYKRIRAYVQHFHQVRNEVADDGSFITRLFGGSAGGTRRKTVAVTEILSANAWQRYEDGILAAEGANPLGRVPVIHIQNLPQPGFYEGLGDVAQLMPLQDELNTRLSDRASRITMQSFKMYLAKGIDGMPDKPVSPGRMWCTDNLDATIEAFGGDAASPSEDLHIAEIREALDKVSGVTPVVAGVLKNKLGNLSSAVALKMTFMGMLSKTYRKQLTYGQGIKDICKMTLELLDKANIFKTDLNERDIEVIFPNPIEETIE
ncbi:MAG: phage portal protein [Phycisphaerae bacterium]|nr:phage portal protein [Phycisphaerae bacterium]